MITYNEQVAIAKALLSKGLGFRKFFINAEQQKNSNNQVMPVIRKANEFVYCGWDDQLGLFGYFRHIDSPKFNYQEDDACTARTAWASRTVRLVVIDANCKWEQNELTQIIINTLFGKVLVGIHDQMIQLFSIEQTNAELPGVDAKSYYRAFDFTVERVVKLSTCATEIDCSTLPMEICEPIT